MQAPKYHIYIEYAELEKSGFRFNLPQEELKRTFSEPFSAGKPFWFLGRLLNPLKVTKAVLFWSYETADKLRLPNQDNLVAAKDKKYVMESIEKGKLGESRRRKAKEPKPAHILRREKRREECAGHGSQLPK